MIKNLTTRLLVLLSVFFALLNEASAVPTTINALYPSQNTNVFSGGGGPMFITFSVTNNNPYPVAITGINMFHPGAGFAGFPFVANGKSYTIWNSFTNVTGPATPIATTNAWSIVTTTPPITNATNAIYPIATGLNIIIPPASCGGNTCRFAIVCDTLFASGYQISNVLQPISPVSFTTNGVTMTTVSSSQFLGTFPNSGIAVTSINNYCAFNGGIVFDTGATLKLPPPTIIAARNPICYGTGDTLTASSIPSCWGTPTYFWYGPGGFLGTGQSISLGNITQTGIYTCRVKTPLTDTSDAGTIIINVIDPPAPIVTGKFQYCLNEPYEPFTVNGTSPKYYYLSSGGAQIPITPTFNTTTVNSDSIFVTQTVNGCESRTRTGVYFSAAPKPVAPKVTSPIFYCENSVPTPLTAQGQNLLWYYDAVGGYPSIYPPTPQTSVKDTLAFFVAQKVDGCEGPRSKIDVIVTFKPNGLIVPSRMELCQNDTLSINYYGSAYDTAAFNWGAPEGVLPISGIGKGPIVYKFTKPGTVKLDLRVGNEGCLSENVLENIKVDPMPSAEIHANENLCLGRMELVSLTSYTPTIDSFFWDFDGGNTSHYATDQGPYGVSWNNAGVHIIALRVIDELCDTTYRDTINVHDKPDAKINIDNFNSNSVFCAGDSIKMTANTIKPASKYNWTPARFFDTYNDLPITFGRVDFTDTIHLSVTDEYGCTNTGSVYIKTKPCCEITFPNAFTPNGDGKNDVFRPITAGWRELKSFRIFNRWGVTVFETTDIRKGWDGNFNGEPQDLGNYFYSIIFKCEDKLTEQKGEVVLIR